MAGWPDRLREHLELMRLSDFEGIEWDDDEDEGGNLAHCRRSDRLGPNPERVVDEVLREQPVQVKFRTVTADFVIVGPDFSRSILWLIVFRRSDRRGDWLRPVTGWKAEAAEIRQWEKQRGKLTP
jgi:hypothetical protein